jgi:hypothetical protein
MCPNINLLKTYGVYPSKVDFQYQSYKFFIYVYLNPFKEYKRPVIHKAGFPEQEFCFAYEPIYIGKGTGPGYRQNQHLSAFLNKKENNAWKVKTFNEIQANMAKAAANMQTDKPWNWEEYKKKYVKVLETFTTPKELLDFEMDLINSIGTQAKGNGPLTNKITNAYKTNNLSSGPKDFF